MKPVEWVNGLVAGVILATYGFLGLLGLAIAIPFTRRSRHFWRNLIRVEAQLSSLTFLALSAIAAVLAFDGVSVKSVYASIEGSQGDIEVTYCVFAGLILTALLDVAILLLSLILQERRRQRSLHRNVARICLGLLLIGGILLTQLHPRGAVVDIAYNSGFIFGSLPRIFTSEFLRKLLPDLAILVLFTLPLFVVTNRRVNRRRVWPLTFLLGIAVTVLLPVGLAYVGGYSFLFASAIVESFVVETQKSSAVYARDTSCVSRGNGNILVSAYLRLEGMESLPIQSKDVTIYYTPPAPDTPPDPLATLGAEEGDGSQPDQEEVELAQGLDDGTAFVLEGKRYVAVRFAAAVLNAAKFPNSESLESCSLHFPVASEKYDTEVKR